ncbi:MAG: hypothetical protein AAGI24_17030 [Pseudomonadota bacterium]
MSNLSKILVFKIVATIVFWCVPLVLLPAGVLESLGFPKQQSYMFVRMLGWAYLALCIGYFVGLQASLNGKRLMGPIWVGLVSNGGACVYLTYYGVTGAWLQWGVLIQFVGWSSIVATAAITIGLFLFGVKGNDPVVT